MKGKNTGAVTVRGLDTDIITALEQAASRHDRTKEGEARAAIRAWVQPELSAIEHTLREQGERLSYVLQQVQQVPEGRRVTASRVAELIGEAKASQVVSGFQGEYELSFQQLEAIANLLGASPEWMKHGTGVPFPTAGLMDIYSADDLFQSDREISKVRLVRTSDETGCLYIIREFVDSLSAEIFSTRYHISEDIGATGEGDLCRLFPIFKELFHNNKINIYSYLINPEYVQGKEYAGMLHPLVIADQAKKSAWFEDIWDDKSHSRTIEHWPGMIQLRKRILEAIEIKESRK